MSGEPNRDTPPPGFSSFLPRGFGWPTPILPPPPRTQASHPQVRDLSVRPAAASVRQVAQLRDRLPVCRPKFALVHLRRGDPAAVVHLIRPGPTPPSPASGAA